MQLQEIVAALKGQCQTPSGEGQENRHPCSTGPAEPKKVKRLFDSRNARKFNGEMEVEFSVVTWLATLEFQLMSQAIPQEQWVSSAQGLMGENVTNWITSSCWNANMNRQEKMKWEALNTGRMSWDDFTKLMRKKWLSPDFPIRLMTVLRDMKQGPKESISNFIQRYSAMTNRLVACAPDKVSFGNFVIKQIFNFGKRQGNTHRRRARSTWQFLRLRAKSTRLRQWHFELFDPDTGADENFIDEQLESDEPIAVEMATGVGEIPKGSFNSNHTRNTASI
ncbi:hypothetical protein GUITHDRAFT_101326 [Guillardia theta CCMP2712]|uniref:Retrotransposon gag domain-containing protein n=1 Tax=Guillardia theta (strain CCMP2712) TaxID=905079 RepID=L1JWZ7_GUITC|nr:hypothetical protein GUITHDRAFT_101326 [Guillardia theta CCMP2712]EKX52872.1 hypothetical protein GUITHDRAFT_101326 [Guillardia theta CCMP2712]|eukprot:XP_005839852.1 hypothetical protein GUITHDRAFT_101326 [Guillardia theta CCMP2712]